MIRIHYILKYYDYTIGFNPNSAIYYVLGEGQLLDVKRFFSGTKEKMYSYDPASWRNNQETFKRAHSIPQSTLRIIYD